MSNAQLDTDCVFIDTEVFVRERFDWNSSSFNRLRELVKAKQLRVLTTSITKNEVTRKQREALDHAAKAVAKHEVILGRLGASTATTTVSAPGASAELEAQFQSLLADIGAREVPLHANLDELFEGYFAQSPPFSGGKKSEFPDAVVLSSLRKWCSESGKKLYAVSGDPDFKIACGEGGPLLQVDRLADVISMATVTKQVHDDLLRFVAASESVAEQVYEALRRCPVKVRGLYRFDVVDSVDAVVTDATELEVSHLSVISRDKDVFICEVEVSVTLFIDLTINTISRYVGYEDDYDPSETIYESDAVTEYFFPIVKVSFDPANPSTAEIESVDFRPDNVEVEASDLDELRRVFRRF